MSLLSLPGITFVQDLYQSRPRLAFWGGLIVIMLFGTVQAAVSRFGQGLSIDEPFTANMVQLPLPQMFEAFWQDEASHLYYILLNGWGYVFGESEFAPRSLSLLFFGLTVLTVGLTARLAERSRSTVWLFYDSDYGQEVTDILRSQLNRQLSFNQALDLRGSFFDSVLVYSTDREEIISSSTH